MYWWLHSSTSIPVTGNLIDFLIVFNRLSSKTGHVCYIYIFCIVVVYTQSPVFFCLFLTFQSTVSQSVLCLRLNIIKWTWLKHQTDRQADWCWRDWMSRAPGLPSWLFLYHVISKTPVKLEDGSRKERKKRAKNDFVLSLWAILLAAFVPPFLRETQWQLLIQSSKRSGNYRRNTTSGLLLPPHETRARGVRGGVSRPRWYQVRSNCCQRNASAAWTQTHWLTHTLHG